MVFNTISVRGDSPFTSLSAGALEVGQIGYVVTPEYMGEIVLRHFAGLVSLTNPQNTWAATTTTTWGPQVIPIPEGTKVTLVAGEPGGRLKKCRRPGAACPG